MLVLLVPTIRSGRALRFAAIYDVGLIGRLSCRKIAGRRTTPSTVEGVLTGGVYNVKKVH